MDLNEKRGSQLKRFQNAGLDDACSFLLCLNSNARVASYIYIFSLKNVFDSGKNRRDPLPCFPRPRDTQCKAPLQRTEFICAVLPPRVLPMHLMGGGGGGTQCVNLCNRVSYSTPCPLVPPRKQAITGFMRVHKFPLPLRQ